MNKSAEWIGIGLTVTASLLVLKRWFNGPVYKKNIEIPKKVVIITGANGGIGYETALDLARRGAHVILACRDLDKATEAAKKIQQKTNKKSSIEILPIELASLSSIKNFADEFKKNHQSLDILINNAAIFGYPKLKSVEGFDLQMAANYIGHFYLTNLLIEQLSKSGNGRVINVSSEAPRGYFLFDLEDLNFERRDYSPMASYSQSKFANVLFANELNRRYSKTHNITSVSLHPGFVRTGIFSRFIQRLNHIERAFFYLFAPFLYLISKTSYYGAQTSIFCAVDPNIVGGKYYHNFEAIKPFPLSEDEDLGKALWEKTESLIHSVRGNN